MLLCVCVWCHFISFFVLKVSIVLQVLGWLEAVCGDEEGYEGQGSLCAKDSASKTARGIFQCLGGLRSDYSGQERCQTESIRTRKSKQIEVNRWRT